MKCAKVLLIKALHYAWYYGSIDFESQLYDDLGLYYYYQSEIDLAYYFHTRCMRQKLQDQKLPVVENSNDEIDQLHDTKFNLYNRYKESDKVHENLAGKLKDNWKFDMEEIEENLYKYIPQGKKALSL